MTKLPNASMLMFRCRRVNAREKASQAEEAALKALENARHARQISEHFSHSPTATQYTSDLQLGELTTCVTGVIKVRTYRS